jgi:light-regulated signal transduction histidine kinase (bacteriophytochrome)
MAERISLAVEDVKKYASHLQHANSDLEAFTYSVSHDLRAPLRAIDSFSKILAEDHAACLDEEGTRVLNVITHNTQKMGLLIDNLLAFSRLDRKEVKKGLIRMNHLVDDIIQEMQFLYKGKNIQMEIEKLPDAFCDRSLLHEVISNLISNAFKFTMFRQPPVIKIGAKTDDSKKTVYYVSDNGVGFDMKYSEKLFAVFQRLHSQKRFEGTGVGLAIVDRIIQKHGGQVWAEGEVDKGATFYFSLPVKDETNALPE